MKRIWSRMLVRAAVTGVLLLAASGPAGTAWSAARTVGARVITHDARQTVTDHSVSGYETSASCLTASLCVAVGSQIPLPARSHGVVVTLTNGAQSHVVVLRRSSVMDSVSCRKSGCWAVGRPAHGIGAYLVKISSAGRPVAERTVPVRGASLGAIWCASMGSCEITGADNRLRPAAIEIGDWNGKKLYLHRVAVRGSKRMTMPGFSCWRSDCEAVGSALVGSARAGLILTTAGGRPARLNADSGYPYLDSVSCISARTCYAVGGGIGSVETVTRGVVTHSEGGAGGGLSAIECTASGCEAAGTILLPQYSTQDGLLQSLSDETWGASIDDGASYVFSGIAGRGGSGGFIAIGTGATAAGGSDVAVG